MQPKSVYSVGSWSKTDYDTLNGTQSSFTFDTSARDVLVTCPLLMNYGNFKDPTNWSYQIDKTSAFSASYYTKSLNGRFITEASGKFNEVPNRHDLAIDDLKRNKDIAYNNALSDVFEKMRGNIDLSIDAFQIRSTADMLKNPLKSLVDNADGGTRKFGPLGWYARGLSGAVLATQYGWRPLLGEIYDIVGRLGNNNPDKPTITWFTGKGKKTSSFSTKMNVSLGGVSFKDAKLMLTAQAKCRIGIGVRLKDENLIQLAGHYTSLNPASIAWELMPYSFVIDWLYDVGGYLRNMETALAYNSIFASGYISTIDVTRSNYEINSIPTNTTIFGHALGSGYASRVTFNRAKQGSLPFPRLPIIDLHMGSERLINAAALIGQFLTKKRH